MEGPLVGAFGVGNAVGKLADGDPEGAPVGREMVGKFDGPSGGESQQYQR